LELVEVAELTLTVFISDLSWQTSLASSAVTAAEDVRAAVRVSRTAANARAAASSAAFSAQTACEKGEFANLDEARAAQTRASIAQSHAIHAAVVEHEAKTVKRRATLALAHDVKTWNVHRKREMLRSCIAFARSQHEATRRSVDAWSTLRDGFVGTPVNPSIVERRAAPHSPLSYAPSAPEPRPLVEPGEVTATIYESMSFALHLDCPPTIVAVDHNVLAIAAAELFHSESPETLESTTEPTKSVEIQEPESILPFAEAAPIPDEEADDLVNFQYNEDNNTGSSSLHEPTYESSFTDEKLSASMQSLVDGLMNWGGGFDADEDHFALPIGMAASIVLEETHVLGKSYNIA
jgi:cellobiose-specific phosphotransferase system component IIA